MISVISNGGAKIVLITECISSRARRMVEELFVAPAVFPLALSGSPLFCSRYADHLN